MKTLYLLRGLPGAGKSTLAQSLNARNYEADAYFMTYGEYKFNPAYLREAHAWCKEAVESSMIFDQTIAVSNTFTQEWEMKPYYELAEKYGYIVFSLIVESRHLGSNIHNVPIETIEKMRQRFEIKL